MAMDRLETRLARAAHHRGSAGFVFDDLVRAARQVGVDSLAAVADWLAAARSSGLLEDVGFDLLPDGTGFGPRRYRIRQVERPAVEHVAG